MGLYQNNNGTLVPIAGRGKAEYGASTVRTGTAPIPKFETGDAISKNVQVTFDSPMPDTDYIVNLEELSNTNIYTLRVSEKTVNGFTIVARLAFATTTTVEQGPIIARSIYWKAFKLYTDNEYNGLLNNQRYSTDEIDTGKTWIDGKPIYRKVISNLTMPTQFGSSVDTPTGLANSEVDTLIRCYGVINSNYTTPHINSSAESMVSMNGLRSGANIAVRTIIVKLTSDASLPTLQNGFAVIEYTKTTD